MQVISSDLIPVLLKVCYMLRALHEIVSLTDKTLSTNGVRYVLNSSISSEFRIRHIVVRVGRDLFVYTNSRLK